MGVMNIIDKTKAIKKYGVLTFLAILLILSILGDGYIAGIPIDKLWVSISIVVLIINGIKKIKDKNPWGWIDISISLGLLFISIN